MLIEYTAVISITHELKINQGEAAWGRSKSREAGAIAIPFKVPYLVSN